MNQSDEQKIVSLMKQNCLHAYLATCDGDQPRLRPVSPIVEDNMSIWVTTYSTSRKVKQVGQNPRICLAFVQQPNGDKAATVVGEAQIIPDIEERKRVWKLATFDLWEHFPNGPDSDEFCLLRIVIKRIEWRDSWTGKARIYEPAQNGTISEYDRERIGRLFDNMTDGKTMTREYAARLIKSIPQLAGEVAFRRLELGHEDVLLDVGTGTGDKAIAAAGICRQVVGVDVSRKSLERARMKLERESLGNVVFAYGGFEDPCAELDLASYGITKILAVYSLHHLPDQLKKRSLITLANLLHRPGRMVIGDIIFFEDPNQHRAEFDEVHYDAGDTDFPSRVEYLTDCLEQMGARVHVEQIHPLVGVIVADFA